jgi:hypothetical protein
MAIESERKRQIITERIERWTKHTKIKPYLRDYDIPHLVDSIIRDFYHVGLCCGHVVRDICEGIHLEMDDADGKTYGLYCKDCAERMIKEGWAKEVKSNPVGNAEL